MTGGIVFSKSFSIPTSAGIVRRLIASSVRPTSDGFTTGNELDAFVQAFETGRKRTHQADTEKPGSAVFLPPPKARANARAATQSSGIIWGS